MSWNPEPPAVKKKRGSRLAGLTYAPTHLHFCSLYVLIPAPFGRRVEED